MRIRSVRLQNLNSLSGHWSIDLEHPAYNQDGMFLISGTTGAGKTTILDAIALALYGQTPRCIPSKSKNDFMSHGSNECSAEVVFETGKGRFTAVWQQKRAKKAKDPFQAPTHKIYDETGENLGEKSKQTLATIEELTGLDFKQFKRAVLLAQSEFNSFLDATPNEKAAILEKLTDTGIYSKLSEFAFKRFREAEQAMQAVQDKIQNLAVLTSAEIDAKKAEINQLTEEQKQYAVNLENAAKQLAWLKEIEENQTALNQIMTDLNRLAIDKAAFEPQAQELALAKKCALFNADYASLTAKRDQIQKNHNNLEQQIKAATSLQDEEHFLADKATEAKMQENLAAERLEQNRPLLEKARYLDARLLDARNDLNTLTENEQNLNTACQKKIAIFEKQQLELNKQQIQAASLDDWLKANKNIEWLEENLAAVKTRITAYTARLAEAQAAKTECARNAEAVQKIQRQISENEAELNRLLRDEQTIAQTWANLNKKQAELLGGWTLAGLKENLKAKQDAWRVAGIYKSLEQHRKELKANTPCPLCGALEHPFAAGNLPDPDDLQTTCVALEQQIADAEQNQKMLDAEKQKKQQIEERMLAANKTRELLTQQQKQASQNYEASQQRAEYLQQDADASEQTIRLELAPWQQGEQMPLQEASQHLEQLLLKWRDTKAEAETIAQWIQNASVNLARAESDCNQTQKELQNLRHEIAGKENLLASLQNERQQYFNGENADRMQQEMERAVAISKDVFLQLDQKLDDARKELKKTQGSIETLQKDLSESEPALMEAEAAFARALQIADLTEELFMLGRRATETVAMLEEKEKYFQDQHIKLSALQDKTAEKLNQLRAMNLTQANSQQIQEQISLIKDGDQSLKERVAQLNYELALNEANKSKAEVLEQQLSPLKREYAIRQKLNRLIGAAEGQKFRKVVQHITLGVLLANANVQLAKISDRYALTPDKNESMTLKIIDYYQAGEERSIKSLSGGETFQICLALALGLSNMAGLENRVNSLFMDEGFGSLDSDTLETAITAIDNLRQEGKLIGIISHVEALKERINLKITVSQTGRPGYSMLSGPGVTAGQQTS